MNTTAACLLALSMLFAGPANDRARATSTRGSAKATVTVRGMTVRAKAANAGRTGIDASVHLDRTCAAQKLAELIATEMTQNPDALRTGRRVTIEAWPFRARRPGRGGAGEAGERDDSMAGFEKQLADILATGNHDAAAGGKGKTCFDGVNLDLGALIQANLQLPPQDAATQTLADGSTVKTASKDGITTTWTSDASGQHVAVASTMAPASIGGGSYASGSQVSVKTTGSGQLAAHEVTHVAQQRDGASTTNVEASGGTVTEAKQSESSTSGGSTTEVSQTTKPTGNGTVTTTEVKSDGKTVYAETETKAKDGDNDSGGPTLTAEGVLKMPPMCVSDEAMASLINWNRLGDAVTYPSPIADAEGQPDAGHSSDVLGPCGSDDGGDFDPDPAYLRPNVQGWVTDPVPFLRRRGR